jgi:hypothetical protein
MTISPPSRVRVPRHAARLVVQLVVDYFDYAAHPVASARHAARHAARHRILRLRHASGCFGTSRGLSHDSSSTTSTTPRVRVPRHVVWLVVDYFAYVTRSGASARHAALRAARRRLLRLRHASECLGTSHGTSRGSSSTTSPTPRIRVPRLVTLLVVDYFDYVVRPVASAHRAACRVTHRRLLRLAQARRRLLRLPRTSGCLGTSRGSSRGLSLTTSTTLHVRLLRHVAWLVTPLVVDYFASRRLVDDYFASAVCPGASARRAARHVARRRLLRPRRTSGCFGTSRGSSCGSPSTTSTTPRVRLLRHVARLVMWLAIDYFDYAARPVASARRAARHAAHHRLLRLTQARRQLFGLRRASGCLGTLHGLSCGSSSTTSPTPRVRVPRHVTRLVTLALLHPRRASRLLVSRQHWFYFEYAACRRDVVFRSCRVDHSSRLVFQTSQERQCDAPGFRPG